MQTLSISLFLPFSHPFSLFISFSLNLSRSLFFSEPCSCLSFSCSLDKFQLHLLFLYPLFETFFLILSLYKYLNLKNASLSRAVCLSAINFSFFFMIFFCLSIFYSSLFFILSELVFLSFHSDFFNVEHCISVSHLKPNFNFVMYILP